MKWGVLVLVLLLVACQQEVVEVEENVSMLNNLGFYYAQQGDPAKAIENFEKVLEIDVSHQVARKNLALLYHQLGDYDEAIKHFTILVGFDSENPSYHYDLAISLAEKCRVLNECALDKAIMHFERADEIDPGFQMARQNIEALKQVRQNLEVSQG